MSLLLYGTIVGLVLVIATVQLAADHRFARLRVTRIADCQDGQIVKVVGRAVAITELPAPFSGRPCVAYRITGTRTKTVERGRAMRSATHIDKFIVKDESGEAIVDPSGLVSFGHGHLRLDGDIGKRGRWRDDAAKALPLDLLDMPTADLVDETIVAVGELIAVRARVVIDGSIRQVRLVADKARHMVVTDQQRLIGRR